MAFLGPITAFSYKFFYKCDCPIFREPYSGIFKPYSGVFKPYSDVLKPYSGVFLQIFFCVITPFQGALSGVFKPYSDVLKPYNGVFKPYSNVLKPYSGVLELEFHKLEFHAIFFFFFYQA